jgi:hypothetical protein
LVELIGVRWCGLFFPLAVPAAMSPSRACSTLGCCARHPRAPGCTTTARRSRNCTYASVAERSRPLHVRCPARPAPRPPAAGIPSIVHFVYGLRRNATFGFTHYAAIRSALAVHRPRRLLFHYTHRPAGEFFEALAPAMELVHHAPVESAMGRCVAHVAHKADFVRLHVLREYGGLYLDIDTLSLRPLPAALRQSAEFVIAKQLPNGARDRAPPCSPRGDGSFACDEHPLERGLCNAVMAAAPGARFASHWLGHYANFRSSGKGSLWAEHSVSLPARLWERCGEAAFGGSKALSVLPPSAFFPFYWLESASFLTQPHTAKTSQSLQDTYVVHLWGRGAWQLNGGAGGGSTARLRPPRRPSERCRSLYSKTAYGHFACQYAGSGSGMLDKTRPQAPDFDSGIRMMSGEN